MEARLRPFGVLFARSLNDLIVGIRRRHDPDDLSEYLKRMISECREESHSADPDIKALAVLKLAYLEMYGYSMSWAQFQVLEVMSASKFQQKRIGYLAASQCLHGNDELLMLATNLVKSDLAASTQLKVGVALSGISSFVTPHLASDISEDVLKMLNHSQPYVRKKAILAAYKVVLQYPEVLPQLLDRLREKLRDPDGSVVAASINVLCELTNQSHEKKHYLEFVPLLYNIMTDTTNNWCMVKLLKLFAVFTDIEPRIATKVKPIVVNLLEETQALSLVLETTNCLLRGSMLSPDDWSLAKTVVQKLESTLEYKDANLTFVVLEAFTRIAQINSQFLAEQYASIFALIEDQDLAVRRNVLNLLPHITDEETIAETVEQLISQIATPPDSTNRASVPWISYVEQLVKVIVELCSKDNYDLVPNFDWYVEQLVVMVHSAPHMEPGQVKQVAGIVGSQFLDIALRVPSARVTIIKACMGLESREAELLSRVVFVMGEYSEVAISSGVNRRDLLDTVILYAPSSGLTGPPAIAKLLAAWSRLIVNWDESEKDALLVSFKDAISYLDSQGAKILGAEVESRERTAQVSELLRLGCEALNSTSLSADRPPALLTVGFTSLFQAWDMVPVSKAAMQHVTLPPGLDLTIAVDLPSPPLTQASESESESDLEPESQESSQQEDSQMSASSHLRDPFYIDSGRLSTPPQPTTSQSESDSSVAKYKSEKPARKVARVKVAIASDETLGAPASAAPSKDPLQKRGSILQVASRLNEIKLDEAEHDARTAPVVVKHKKVKKKKRIADI